MGRAITGGVSPQPAREARSWRRVRLTLGRLNPIQALWRLLTSVRFAIGLVSFMALVSFLGVVLPQTPAAVRDDPARLSQWLEFQQGKFGGFTDILFRLGLFNVFGSLWFAATLGLLVVSVVVCTIARYPSIRRTISRPPKRVPDTFFKRTQHRLELAPIDPGHLERLLRRRRYAVERSEEGDTTYLFADRFQWAQLGTFASHLALIIFIAAALVSRFTGFSQQVAIAEGSSAPVFTGRQSDQMQVQVLDAVGLFNERGQAIDYHTDVLIFQGGQEVRSCTITVNSPCKHNGYRFHQAAYFGYGAEVEVRDTNTGNVVYREVLALLDQLPGPHVIVRDSDGETLINETVISAELVEGTFGRSVTLPSGGRSFWMGVTPDTTGEDWRLAAFETSGGEEDIRLLIDEGERVRAGGLEFELVGVSAVPASAETDFPIPAGVLATGGTGPVLLQLGNVVYGSAEASAGGTLDVPMTDGPPVLSISGPLVMDLKSGESVTIDDYEYTFVGQREFAGIQVKKDQSDNIVWLGTGLLVAGLTVTFWVPRRRIWAKITRDRTYIAGQANRLADLANEMRQLASQADVNEKESEDGSE